jgi:DNA mismatch endonuclease (patch repair protein)
MDTLTPEERSERMSRIRGRDTKPEMIVRNVVHRMGYRYRLHVSNLPGKPDLVLPRHGKIIFVHGCFWHRHPRCSLARIPKTRKEFWIPKLEGNRRRDLQTNRRLSKQGWSVLIIWECEIMEFDKLEAKLRSFLEDRQ